MTPEEESAQLKREAIERERRIAITCEQRLTSALQGKISSLGFKDHIARNGKKKMSEAYAESNFSRAVKRGWSEQTGFQMLSIMMERHGFVQHYGVDRIRKADTKGKMKRGGFHLHIQKKPFIVDAIKNSGVIEYAAQELGGAKADYILKNIKYMLDKFDK